MPNWRLFPLCTVAATTLTFGAACLDRSLSPIVPCTKSVVVERVRQDAVENVDLLFVIDTSSSMEREQAALAREIPRLVEVLTTGNLDDDPEAEFPPVRDLHVGLVSTDLGAAGETVDRAACTGLGDDGELQLPARCGGDGNRYLSFRPADFSDAAREEAAAQFSESVRCAAGLGTGGCNFEQPLEAALKAITPSSCDAAHCRFLHGAGHGDTLHAGFVREDSVLAIVILTDEEDCSAQSAALYQGELSNLRCLGRPEHLHPIERYVEGFAAARPDNPRRLVFAAIAGAPLDRTVDTGDAGEFRSLLTDLESRPGVDPLCDGSMGEPASCPRPPFVCQSRGSDAQAPTRIVRVAEGLKARGASAVVQSICQDDFRPALDSVISQIVKALPPCLPRPLNPRANGTVPCDVVETLPEGAACGEGRTDLGFEDGRRRCSMPQLPTGGDTEPTAAGWYYDDFSEAAANCGGEGRGQRIAFSGPEDARPASGTDVLLECLQPVMSAEPAVIDQGARCFAADATCAAGEAPAQDPTRRCNRDLFCEPTLRTWEIGCAADVDCPVGYRCDEALERPRCINPTCNDGS